MSGTQTDHILHSFIAYQCDFHYFDVMREKILPLSNLEMLRIHLKLGHVHQLSELVSYF